MNDQLLSIRSVVAGPFEDQRPGTAGLRKKVATFEQAHYLETFIEAILSTAELGQASRVVIGGDGRYFNTQAIQTIIRMAAAHGCHELIVGRDGLLSTPAASNLIRKRGAAGGFVLTASHNPGGPDGDFGIKFNIRTGGQAPESLTDAIFDASRRIRGYEIADLPEIDLSRAGKTRIGPLIVDVVDPVADYAALMESLFDFDAMAAFIANGATLCFDAMHGVTGPYAEEIFCRRLGAPADALLRSQPLPDFGGLHPDPNPLECRKLVDRIKADDAPALAAASDGDGDRNMILGPNLELSPCDSVAIMLAHADSIPGYRGGIPGVARSMPTSRALDAVAETLGLPCYETPTGWRFFCNLLEAGMIGLCGEESFGTGSAHAREKDGLWAVLYWLNLISADRRPLPEIVAAHWARFGRHYYQRHDYFIAAADQADALVEALRRTIAGLPGQSIAGRQISSADDFVYRDPVDHSSSEHQGIRICFADGARIVYRLSGTGTAGATLRVYLERFEQRPDRLAHEPGAVLADLGRQASEIARIEHFAGLSRPSSVV